MKMLYEISISFLNQYSHSLSQRFTRVLRSVLLSSYINNILGTITALATFTLVTTTAIAFSDYPISESFIKPVIITSLTLIIISLTTVMILMKEMKVEKMLGLHQKSSPDLKSILLPILNQYLESSKPTNQEVKIERLEKALRLTTEVIQELEVKIESLERDQNQVHPQQSRLQELH